MIEIFQNIINSGTPYQTSLFDQRKVRILNILYLISILSAETYNIVYLIIDCSQFWLPIVVSNIFVIICVLGIILNRYNKILLSQHLLCSGLTLVTYVNTFFFLGAAAYIHFYFLLFAVSPLLVWRLKQLLPILFYFTANTFLFIYAEFLWNPANALIVFPAKIAMLVGVFTVISTFFSLLAALWINLLHIEENESQLIAQSRKLAEVVEELNAQHVEILQQKTTLDELNNKLSQQNQSLIELNATKDKFFSIISHDLKSPFSSILGFSELLATEYYEMDNDEIYKIILHVNNSTQQTYKLLDNLLEWSRSQSGTIVYTPVNLSLEGIISETINMSKNAAASKFISINCHLEKQFVVYADKEMLSAILRNLLNNAIKYTNRNGVVSVDAKLQDNNVLNSISDSGIGMSESLRNQIFKITEKVSRPGTEMEKGTGLGLILCKEFVEKHGGKIWVESQSGKGSCFKFTMPLNQIYTNPI